MLYEQFIEKIKDGVEEKLGKEYVVIIHSQMKNNGHMRKGLLIRDQEVNISPTIYLEEFFEKYKNGVCVEELVQEIMEIYQEVRMKRSWKVDHVLEYEKIEQRVIYRLVNYEKNKELLEELPFLKYLDLAIIFQVVIQAEIGSNQMITMPVKKEHLGWWKVTEQELFQAASENTCRWLPSEICGMEAVLKDFLDEEEKELCKKRMYVVSNELHNHGATSILYDGLLEHMADILGGNYYLLPSSVHEVILVTEESTEDIEVMKQSVIDINKEYVEEEDILSDYVYFYDQQEKKLHQVV